MLVLLSNHVEVSVVPFLRLLLIVLEKPVVAQGRWRHIAAEAVAGAVAWCPILKRMSY
jgi:hypothetical protein